MRVVDEQRCTDRSLSPISCIEKGVGGHIVLWTDPLALQHAPQGFCNVEMRRVRWKIKEEKTPAFPYWPHLLHDAAAVELALSRTMTVFLSLDWRDSLSRKSASLAAVMLPREVKPSYRLSRVVMPNMLRRAIFWDGMWMSSPRNCQP